MKAKFKPTTGVVYPFDTQEFYDTWGLFLAYRKQIKKPIIGSIAEQGQLKKLSRLCNANQETAIAIIEQSIENTWRGLFTLKINYNENRKNQAADLSEALNRRFQA